MEFCLVQVPVSQPKRFDNISIVPFLRLYHYYDLLKHIVALPQPTTDGIPSWRATIAAWLSGAPRSVMTATFDVLRTTQFFLQPAGVAIECSCEVVEFRRPAVYTLRTIQCEGLRIYLQ
jgi:hypothetical protein